MQNYEKIEQLREELHKTVDPKIVEYVNAELNYSHEIAYGHTQFDQLKAERRLIAAIQGLGVT